MQVVEDNDTFKEGGQAPKLTKFLPKIPLNYYTSLRIPPGIYNNYSQYIMAAIIN